MKERKKRVKLNNKAKSKERKKRVNLNNSVALWQNATHETVIWIRKREILRPRDREKKTQIDQ